MSKRFRKSSKEEIFSFKKFSEEFSAESAYMLGLIWADGYIHKRKKAKGYSVGIEMIKEDLAPLIDIFSRYFPWKIYSRCRAGRKPQIAFSATNKPFYEFLQSNDYITKSFESPNKIIQYIPEPLHKYWWRGYFDGDGCLYIKEKGSLYQLSFTSSYDQNWSFVGKFCEDLNIKHNAIKRMVTNRGHSYSQIVITKRKFVYEAMYYIYKDKPHIGIKRKRDKAINFINSSL